MKVLVWLSTLVTVLAATLVLVIVGGVVTIFATKAQRWDLLAGLRRAGAMCWSRSHHFTRHRRRRLYHGAAARPRRRARQTLWRADPQEPARGLHHDRPRSAGTDPDPAALLRRHPVPDLSARTGRISAHRHQWRACRYRRARLRPGRLFDRGAARRHPGDPVRPDRCGEGISACPAGCGSTG